MDFLTESEFLRTLWAALTFYGVTAPSADNFLYYGDNLDILRRYIKDDSVDLVYLDPPLKSNQDYNVLFAEQGGSRSAAQIKAFEDTWHWDQEAAQSFHEVVEAGGKVSLAMQAFRTLFGESDMLAYLAMMAPRLVELCRGRCQLVGYSCCVTKSGHGHTARRHEI